MENKRSELRSPPFIALAYFVSSFATGFLDACEGLYFRLTDPAGFDLSANEKLQILFGQTVISAVVCILMEVVFVTPLLVGWKRHQWRWLNTWSAAAIGFLLAALPMFWLGMMRNADGTSEQLGYYVNGQLTQAGLHHAMSNAILTGPLGAICALIFRLVAVRSVSN